MRRLLLLSATVVALCASASRASTLEVRLNAIQVLPASSGLWDIEVQVRTDTDQPSVSAGGIAGLQFDILSSGDGQSVPVAAGVGPLAGTTQTVWDPVITTGGAFTIVTPLRLDATPGLGYPGDTDTDLDSLGGSINDPNNFIKTDLGVNGYVTIATERWQVTSPLGDFLTVTTIGPQWYDFISGVAPSFRRDFDTVITTGVQISVPEPTSLTLCGLGLVAIVRSRRKAIAQSTKCDRQPSATI